MIARVLVPIPKELELDYLVPEKLKDKISAGTRVEVPFFKRKIIGFVYKILDTSEKANKYINRIIDKEPLINEKSIPLSEWMSKRYLISRGEALNTILPSSIRGFPRKKEIEIKEGLLTPEFETKEEKQLSENLYKKLEREKIIAIHIDSLKLKNKIYLDIISKEIKKNKTVLFITPTKQEAENYYFFFLKFFGPNFLNIFLNKTNAEKYKILNDFKKGKIKILIGTRKNIFSYSENLSTIIIEEEGSRFYKEEQKPFYEVAEVAIKRMEIENLKIFFSTNLPSIFLYKFLKENKKEFLHIKNLKIKKEILKKEKKFYPVYITKEIKEKIKNCIRRNKKVFVFHTKQGFYRFLICENCLWSYECEICGQHLTYKKEKNIFFCPSCKREYEKPKICPVCKSRKLIFRGIGRERIEEELKKELPLFTTINLDKFKRLTNGILKESQIIVGGEQFFNILERIKNLGLFVILDFERSFYIPDFRIKELQLRFLNKIEFYLKNYFESPELIIQIMEKKKIFDYFLKENWRDFLEEEINERKKYKFPPFSFILKIEIRSDFKNIPRKNIKIIEEEIKDKIQILQKKFFEKENRFFSDIILKTDRMEDFNLIKDVIQKLKGNYNISIDTNYTLFK